MTITLKEILENKEKEIEDYMKKVESKNGTIIVPNHKSLIQKKDPIAIFINNIENKYKISLKVLKYLMKNNIEEINLTCPVCGNPLNHIKGLSITCSRKCGNSYGTEKAKETCLKKYGVEHPAQAESVKNKAKNTCLSRYGEIAPTLNENIKAKVKDSLSKTYENKEKANKIKEKTIKTNLDRYGKEYYSQTDDFKQRYKKTCTEKYGVDHAFKSAELKEKRKHTWIDKLGVDNPLKSNKVQEKIKKTNVDRYGEENVWKSKEVKRRIRKTLKDKYGVEHALQHKDFLNKSKETCMEKYGVENSSQSKDIKLKCRRNRRKNKYDFFKKLLNNRKIKLLTAYDDYLDSNILKFLCEKCNREFDVLSDSAIPQVWCPSCHKSHSEGEDEIYYFVKSILPNEEIIRNTRKVLTEQKELDIYVPSKKLAIEFDGLFWHSDRFNKDKKYHINKTLECKEKGISLLHIFENEWYEKSEIVKSIIKSKLGIYDTIIYARKCEIKNISDTEYYDFLEDNHLQGYTPAKIKLGLFYDNELVSCIGIGKSRFNSKETELIRYCTKINTLVIGGLSRLIKNSNVKNLISYLDLRYFDGRGYEKINFKLERRTPPGYIYCRGTSVYSRYQCQKHKLQKLLGNKFNKNLTESENMTLAGFSKIYDCGMLKYLFEQIP